MLTIDEIKPILDMECDQCGKKNIEIISIGNHDGHIYTECRCKECKNEFYFD